VRRQFQNHLIDLLQPLVSETLTSTHPMVMHTYKHVKHWLTRPDRDFIGLFALRDISIGDYATLTATPTVRALYANNITIGNEGRLRFTSGAIKVRCSTLTGPPGTRTFLPGLSLEFERR
jgi:hypothetical protein